MLRIVQWEPTTLASVDLDGKLVGPWVDEVRSVIAALRKDQGVCLNLRHLSFADEAGVRLLRALRRDGVHLIGASPLIDSLLQLHHGEVAGEQSSVTQQ